MDKILLNGCRYYGYHGALKEENVLGQIFVIDVELGLDLTPAGRSDQVEDTVHYGLVYETIQKEVEQTRHQLIEHLAETICQQLFREYALIQTICITIRKENPPIAGHYDSVGIYLERSR
ncbi:dihydroneopterin aldolase [Streptococcus halichoeri]|uniref:dihydroneopterin aldolase n=1 Tax=Streptococcus halichoeri TaxID=254785 RepID=UPI001358AA53|nr:dihydroneopterin aldolase [Streptococcus halichoeri]